MSNSLFNSFCKAEVNAIDKFICEALNFESVECCGNYVPRFIAEVDWSCNRQHMVEKWLDMKCTDPSAYFISYYTSLDNTNKQLMLEWIIKNRKNGWL